MNFYEIVECSAKSAIRVTCEAYSFLSGFSNSFLPVPHEQGLGSDGDLNKLGPSLEIGRATDLVGVVMIGALDMIKGLGWLGCIKDLPAQFERDNVVFVAVNDQLRQREMWKAIDQFEFCPEQPMDR
jgi:hypothetical protein